MHAWSQVQEATYRLQSYYKRADNQVPSVCFWQHTFCLACGQLAYEWRSMCQMIEGLIPLQVILNKREPYLKEKKRKSLSADEPPNDRSWVATGRHRLQPSTATSRVEDGAFICETKSRCL